MVAKKESKWLQRKKESGRKERKRAVVKKKESSYKKRKKAVTKKKKAVTKKERKQLAEIERKLSAETESTCKKEKANKEITLALTVAATEHKQKEPLDIIIEL